LPLIQPLTALYPHEQAIDLGCGRGEWLELLVEAGFDAHGIDLDDGMLAECRARGLKVQTLDAISALKALPDNSQALVSGFHLAEHIPFEALQELVQQALRVLKPAGLLILETPNPENIVVGTANFYLDPTHNRPLPPLLLSFLPEYYGFHRVKVLRLQEPVSISQARRFTIHDVLGGVSPDYAVVAQKAAAEDVLQSVSQAFAIEYGVTLGMVSDKYEDQLLHSIQDIDQRIIDLDRNLTLGLTQKINELDVKLNLTLQRVDRDLSSRLNGLEARFTELEASLSPFIKIGNQIRLLRAQGLVGRTKVVTKKILRKIASRGAHFVTAHPQIKSFLIVLTKKLGLFDKLQASRRQAVVVSNANGLKSASTAEVDQALKDFPPAVRQAFNELNAEINKQEKH